MDPSTLAATLAAFLIAGTVKGVIGLGLPPVSLGLLILAMDLPDAIAILIVPSLATNVWQAVAGGGALGTARRIWPFLLPAALFVPVGAMALTRAPLPLLSGLLGVTLAIYAATGLMGLRLSLDGRRERAAAPVLGALNGILTGMTGSFSVPGVLYLQAIGLERDRLVQAMGLLFTTLTLGLAVSLGAGGLVTGPLAALSLAAILPALLGMTLGRRLRRGMPEALFRRVFFAALLALGCYIVAASWLAP